MVVQHPKAKNQREFKVHVNIILRGKPEHQLEEKKSATENIKKLHEIQ